MARLNACCSQKTSLLTMIFLTSSFFILEIVVGYLSNSMALVADSFHMLSDVVSLLVGFFALKISQQALKDRLERNTFGWARAEVLGALINSVFLVALCFSILVEAMKRLVQPEGIEQPLLVLAVGAAGLFVNIFGMLIFQGHVGHGHSHGGHGHSHGGRDHTHNRSKRNKRKSSSVTNTPALDNIASPGIVISNIDATELAAAVSNDGVIISPDELHGVETHLRKMDEPMNLAAEIVPDMSPRDTNESSYNVGLHNVSRYSFRIFVAKTTEEQGINQSTEEQIEVVHKSSSDQMNMRAVYLHVLGDALGSVIVIVSVLIIYFFDGIWTLYVDPAMSIIMVGIILKSSLPLLKESSMILLQTVPTHIQLKDVEKRLLVKFPCIMQVHEFHVWQLAGSKIIASLHIKFSSPNEYIGVSDAIKVFFHNEGIHSTTIQPEFCEDPGILINSQDCLMKCVSQSCAESTCCKTEGTLRRKQVTTRNERPN